jgi:hypothetical protein
MIQKVNSIHLKQLTTETILLQPINVRHSNDKSFLLHQVMGQSI